MRTKRGRKKEKRRREWNIRRRRTNLQRVEFRGKVEDEEKKQIRKIWEQRGEERRKRGEESGTYNNATENAQHCKNTSHNLIPLCVSSW